MSSKYVLKRIQVQQQNNLHLWRGNTIPVATKKNMLMGDFQPHSSAWVKIHLITSATSNISTVMEYECQAEKYTKKGDGASGQGAQIFLADSICDPEEMFSFQATGPLSRD